MQCDTAIWAGPTHWLTRYSVGIGMPIHRAKVRLANGGCPDKSPLRIRVAQRSNTDDLLLYCCGARTSETRTTSRLYDHRSFCRRVCPMARCCPLFPADTAALSCIPADRASHQ